LVHDPGEAWTYSTGTQVLGEVIQSVTGKGLEAALTEMIFSPLGMTSTSYEPRPDQARAHRQGEHGWEPQDLFPRMEIGDAGLIAPAGDYARFLRCLLNDGAPLLRPETFASMIRNQIGELFITEQPACQPGFARAFPTGGGIDKFGYGFQLHLQPAEGMRSPGSYSWCGVANTYFWGDPVKKVGGIVLMQVLPLYEPVCLQTLNGFEARFYDML
ncbi:MAG: serine hydrolase, partial [Proteobacteria bacterium]|nr:serine hydrolase [Pseudomonadota bacterium]